MNARPGRAARFGLAAAAVLALVSGPADAGALAVRVRGAWRTWWRAEALAIAEKTFGPEHPSLAYHLTALGETLLALGSPGGAIPLLERAMSLRSTHPGDPVELAETRFLLARALWNAPRGAGNDRPRADELAELAAEAYGAAGERVASELAEVRAWQSMHKH